jgi:hypothetical protein
VGHRRAGTSAAADVRGGELLEQLSSASFGDAGMALDRQRVLHADGVAAVGLDRQGDPLVALEVLDFLPRADVGGDDLVAIEADQTTLSWGLPSSLTVAQ